MYWKMYVKRHCRLPTFSMEDRRATSLRKLCVHLVPLAPQLTCRSGKRRTGPLLQHGVLRVNCVDCLDRTNAAQVSCLAEEFPSEELTR